MSSLVVCYPLRLCCLSYEIFKIKNANRNRLHVIPYVKMELNELTKCQRRVWDACINSQDHIFCTGEGGTGKSWLLQKLVDYFRKNESTRGKSVAITSSTGLSAFSIRGSTLHSFAGVQIVENDTTEMIRRARKGQSFSNWVDTDILIIDEISMISAMFFDNLSYVGTNIRKTQRPFGGIRLIMFGDFLQLPPVSKNNIRTKMIFEGVVWQKMSIRSFILTEIIRQSNNEFKSVLSKIRIAESNNHVCEFVQKLSRPIVSHNDIGVVNLFPLRREADEYNASKLDLLTSTPHTYKAIDYGDKALLAHCIAPQSVVLKTGAQVMINRNINSVVVNGTVGTVLAFEHDDTSEMLQPIVSVSLVNGHVMTIKPRTCSWETIGARGKVISRRTQIPLMLAWATTIHKSQGQTITKLRVDLEHVFESAQTYVALSRAANHDFLQVVNFTKGKVRADTNSVEFYRKLQSAKDGDGAVIETNTKVHIGFGD